MKIYYEMSNVLFELNLKDTDEIIKKLDKKRIKTLKKNNDQLILKLDKLSEIRKSVVLDLIVKDIILNIKEKPRENFDEIEYTNLVIKANNTLLITDLFIKKLKYKKANILLINLLEILVSYNNSQNELLKEKTI